MIKKGFYGGKGREGDKLFHFLEEIGYYQHVSNKFRQSLQF